MKYTDLFEYRNGELWWVKHNRKAGWKANNGYIRVSINRKHTAAHRIIWEMHNGPIPDGMFIDHKNGIKDDNRIDNLRLTNKSGNEANTGPRANNSSGYKGVYLFKLTGRYRAKIEYNGKEIHLGYFDTAEKASVAYAVKAKEIHGEFAYESSTA